MRYALKEKASKENIKTFDSYAEAKKQLKEYEKEDKENGNYAEGFYEIKEEAKDNKPSDNISTMRAVLIIIVGTTVGVILGLWLFLLSLLLLGWRWSSALN